MKKLLLVSALTLFSTSIYSQSSVKVYTSGGDYVQITITGVNLVVTPTGGDCTFTRAEIDYDISSHNSSGTVISPITLYTLNGRIKCDNSNMSFSLPKSGGIGTASSASSGGHSFIKGNCNAYNSSFCGVISVTINGVGIPNQTVSLNYSPLPVDLVDFYFYINNNIVTLTWTTAQEINNSHFNILKSNNGVDWENNWYCRRQW
ncbi:MAG: hypothetical protein J5I91_00525 [Bacteroidetes bacterium]|nr:hypothetical protein [Bacteroidota bacterium]